MSSQIPRRIRETIIAQAGGLCVNPDCRRQLTSELHVYLGEAAHIRAERPGGQRYITDWNAERLNSAGNLMPLCPTCHRMIDKPEGATQFPEEMLDRWWRTRRREQQLLAVPHSLRVNRNAVDRIVEGIVSGAVEGRPTIDVDELVLINIARKIQVNTLSDRIATQIQWALGQQDRIEEYFAHERRFHPALEGRAQTAVMDEYVRQATNLSSDRLFKGIVTWALQGLDDDESKNAATVLITYFFERCDIFERSDTPC